MPDFVDSDDALMVAMKADLKIGLTQITLTNTDVTLDTTPYNTNLDAPDTGEGAPEEVQGKAYVLWGLVDATESGLATDRLRRATDHLVLIAAWAPDLGSASEIIKALAERYGKLGADRQPLRPQVTGFQTISTTIDRTYAPPSQARTGESPAYGRACDITIVLRPN